MLFLSKLFRSLLLVSSLFAITNIILASNKPCACDPASDRSALLALYNSTNGETWTNKTGWSTNATDLSTWYGISLNGEGCVKALALQNNNLVGTIPVEIGNLTNLEELYLFSNTLSGTIPTEIGNLTNLKILFLYYNQLTGSIPTQIGSLTNLTHLGLNGNQLTGSIPTQIGLLSNINAIYLNNNQLTGSLPTEIGNITTLENLQLNSNQLSGSIPTQIGNLVNLKLIYLHYNQMSGKIPTEIGNLTQLQSLDFSNNSFTGAIPSEIGNLTQLTVLSLYNNQLSGVIPDEIGNLIKLNTLQFQNNTNIVGSIPSSIMNIPAINQYFISLTFNFSNTNVCIPQDATFLTWLEDANSIGNNNPCYVCDVEANRAALLALYNATGGANWTNNTGWSTNAENLASWYGVGVDANTGCITAFDLRDNNLVGTIPAEIGNLKAMKFLNMASNQLSGTIPIEIGELENLQAIDISDNQLTGNIPASMGHLPYLFGMNFSDNPLSGSIPSELTYLNGITIFDFSDTDLCIPQDEAFLEWLNETSSGVTSNNNSCFTLVLSVTNVTANSISVSWNEVTNEVGYQLQRATNEGFTENVQTFEIQANTSSYLDESVTPNTEYFYRVRVIISQN
jgi:Leucine-rich repeat (LRR) protein